MAITTGMREGDLLSLHWEDIDFEKKVVFVHRTVTRIIGQGRQESEPKTKASRRRIVLPDVLLDGLRKHRECEQERRMQAGDQWCELGLVFSNRYGMYFNIGELLKVYRKLLQEAGLPRMRFHDLRHSAATILLVAGVHPKVVQERLGHSTVMMTLDIYSHMLPSMQPEVAEKIDDLFKRS